MGIEESEVQQEEKMTSGFKVRPSFGYSRSKADSLAFKLRDQGFRVREIRTSKKRDLYADYEGLSKDGTPVKASESSVPVRKALTYEDAYSKLPTVPVELHLEGDRRKGSVYAAVITGTDPKYGLKREFLNGDRTYSKNDVEVDYYAKLKPGTIIQVGEGGSWKNKYGRFYVVTPKGLKTLSGNYNNEGTAEIKRLVRKRESVGVR